MEMKQFAALAVLMLALPLVVAATCMLPHGRDVAMFLLVFGLTMSSHANVSLSEREWYRGTNRAIELSWVDIIAIGVTLSMVLRPRKGESRGYFIAGTIPYLIYWLYCLVSVASATPKLFGVYELTKALNGFNVTVAVALYLRSERDLRVVLWALMLAINYEGLTAIKLRYIDLSYRVQGNFAHPNMLSMYMVVTVPVAIATVMSNLPNRLRQCALLAVAVGSISVLLTVSRTGVATLIVTMFMCTVAFVPFRISVKRMVVAFLVLACALGAMAKAWDTLASRFGEASLAQEYKDEDSLGRGYYIRLAKLMVADHPTGVGLNNWSYYVTNVYGAKLGQPYNPYSGTEVEPDYTWIYGSRELPQAAPAHNLAALTVAELGWPGLILFGFVWLRWFHMTGVFLWPRKANPMRRIAGGIFIGLFAAFLQSLTEWELRATEQWLTASALVGIAAALYQFRKTERRAARRRPTEDPQLMPPRPVAGVVARRMDMGR